jgi:hypothetical protein
MHDATKENGGNESESERVWRDALNLNTFRCLLCAL